MSAGRVCVAKACALGATLFVSIMVTPASAGGFWWFGDSPRHALRYELYRDVDLIAYLEANPDIDDAVKGTEIRAANADIRRLRGKLGPPQAPRSLSRSLSWSWAFTPCCYSRPALRIR